MATQLPALLNIVTTDKKGNYELLSNNSVEFIYISVPSGYAFPEDKGIAQFYKPIARNGNSQSLKNDFNLEKLEVDDRKHNFVIWADTQMISEADVALLKTQSVPDLQAVVNAYPKGTLFHGKNQH